MRQKTIRVFEVDNIDNLKKVVESKYDLVKNYYFLLKQNNKEIEKFLKLKKLPYFIVNDQAFTLQKEKTEQIKVIEKEILKEVKPETVFFDKIIRSGEEIINNHNLVFFKRINAGAKIHSEGSIIILDECEGFVECEGEYIFVNKNINGTIIYKGENVGQITNPTLFSEKGNKALK